MNEHESRFVRLCYLSDDPAANIPLLVIEKDSRLQVVIRNGWDCDLSSSDREYLSELISDWHSASGDEIHAILDQLSELSVGPLRTQEWGIADECRRGPLMRRVEHGVADDGPSDS